MKKNRVIKFINKLINTNLINDNVSKENYKLIKNVIEDIDFIKINDLKYIIKKSIPIIKKMYQTYINFQDEYFKKIGNTSVNYATTRKELNYFPSFDEDKGKEIKELIRKINNKYHYQLTIKNIKINIYYYSEKEDPKLFLNLAKIIYLFISTFGINLENYNNYNIRFLLIDFPRILDTKHQTESSSFQELGEKGYFNNSSGVHILSKKELVVSRKSGLTGLLIHELIHLLGLDFCFNFEDNNQVNINNWNIDWINNNNIKKSDNNIVSFIESLCNTNSSYFVAIYNAIFIFDNQKINEERKLIRIFKYLFYIEVIHCYINGVKLLNYFNFDSYDSFFNNTSNRIFYQNALVFEYIIMRMFLIENFYKLLLKKLIKYNFNELTDSSSNINIQNELNQKLIQSIKKKSLRNIFDNILESINNINIKPIFMEYFPLDLLY